MIDESDLPTTNPRIQPDNIPDELKAIPQWVVWRYEHRPGEPKPTKVPYEANSVHRASSTDPSTWATFEDALQTYKTTRGLDGIGLVLTPELDIVGIDLDHVGDWQDEARTIVKQLDSYAEWSPSGNGFRIIAKGSLPGGGNRKGNVEMYCSGRFLTITGNAVSPQHRSVRASQNAINEVHKQWVVGGVVSEELTLVREEPRTGFSKGDSMTDPTLIQRACQNDGFARLWRGDTSGNGSDDSGADQALCNRLAFWTNGDAERVDRLFRQSGLYRPKWERADYRERTIGKAITPYQRTASGDEMVSAVSINAVAAETISLPFHTARQIAEETPEVVPWIAPGWLARGAVTEVDGKIKSAGKTTWVMHMCRAVLDGRPFLGQPTARTSVVYLTEQNPTSLREALRRADLLERDDFHVLYWKDTRDLTWPEVARQAAQYAALVDAGVLIVDILTKFAGLKGEGENSAGEADAACEPLQIAAVNHDLAVLVVRHDRKAGGGVGESARGSTQFGGNVDIIIHIKRGEGNTRPTVRVLEGVGRFDETPATQVIELVANEYVVLGDQVSVASKEARHALLAVMPKTEDEALTEKELFTLAKVKRSTGQEALKVLTTDSTLATLGDGKRGRPKRYFRPLDSVKMVSAGTTHIYAAEINGQVSEDLDELLEDLA